MTSVLNEIVSPAQCLFGFGIPTSEREFEDDLKRPGDKHYAPHHARTLDAFRFGLLETIEQLVPALRATGMTVRTGVTLPMFRSILSERWRAVILLTHWADEPMRIEFADALHSAEEVGAVIPRSFDGIVDLAVCHPIPLGVQLAFGWPDVTVAWRNTTLGARFHLRFYHIVATLLKERPMTYPDAIEAAIELFADRIGTSA